MKARYASYWNWVRYSRRTGKRIKLFRVYMELLGCLESMSQKKRKRRATQQCRRSS